MQHWHRVQQSAGQAHARRMQPRAHSLADLAALLNPMRLIKMSPESACSKKRPHQRAGTHPRHANHPPRHGEWQAEAEIVHEFMRHGARFPAYRQHRSRRQKCLLPALCGKQRYFA